jgi:hypothetical protein
MAELKTQPNDASVLELLDGIVDESKRDDCYEIMNMMEAATGCQPKMWGTSIIGYGTYHYVYASGREGDWMRLGFSPRKQNITLYLMAGVDRHPELLAKIGKFKTGKSCFYIKKLADVDKDILNELIRANLAEVTRLYGQ